MSCGWKPLRCNAAASSARAYSRRPSRPMAVARTAAGSPARCSSTLRPGRVPKATRRDPVQLLALRRLDRGRLALRQQAGTNLGFDVAGDFGMLFQEHAGIFLALTDAFALVAVPGAGLLDDVLRAAHIDDLAFARNALPVHDL